MTTASATQAHALFGVHLPIVLGPLAGGPSTPPLAAAVSNAGGLGSLGEGYVSPDQLRRDVRACKEATDRPFAVNLFAPERVDVDRARIDSAIRALAVYRDELGLAPQAVPERFAEDFGEQLAVVLDEGVPVFTVTFGLLPEETVEALHRSGAIVGVTVTTPAEAVAVRGTGVDFVVAQGSEAGGHRGTFLPAAGDDLIGLATLVPQVRDAAGVPVVAAGGMADGRGIAAALALGASAAQLGTAFLLCPEAGTSAPYRAALRRARAEDTVITSAFSGRRARGLANRLSTDLAGRSDLPPYPVLNALTRDIRRAAAERGDAGLLSLWAGQGVAMVRELPAGDLVRVLAEETAVILADR
jgi:nitronate monooxygenase